MKDTQMSSNKKQTNGKQNTNRNALLTFEKNGSVTLRGRLAEKMQRDANDPGVSVQAVTEIVLSKASVVCFGKLLPAPQRKALESAAVALERSAFAAGCDCITNVIRAKANVFFRGSSVFQRTRI